MKVLSFKIEDETVTVGAPCFCNGKKKGLGDTFSKEQMKKGVFVRHPEEHKLIRIKIVKDEEENMEMLEDVHLKGILNLLPIFILSRISESFIEAFQKRSSRFGPLPAQWTLKWDYTPEEYQKEKPDPPGGYLEIGD